MKGFEKLDLRNWYVQDGLRVYFALVWIPTGDSQYLKVFFKREEFLVRLLIIKARIISTYLVPQ